MGRGNSARARMFTIVIHDVHTNIKDVAENEVKELNPDWSLLAQEEYTHQEGHHLHIFIKYNQPKAFSTVLNFWKKFSETHSAGRVQVDVGRGTFEQCKKYLVDPDKDKHVDSDLKENVRRLTPAEINDRLVVKYPDDTVPCEDCDRPVYFGPGMWVPLASRGLTKITICMRCPACKRLKEEAQPTRPTWNPQPSSSAENL